MSSPRPNPENKSGVTQPEDSVLIRGMTSDSEDNSSQNIETAFSDEEKEIPQKNKE